jgi:hypothetical protein
MIREDRASAGSGGDTSAGGANQPRGQLRRAAALDVGEHSATARNTTPLNIDQFSALIKDLRDSAASGGSVIRSRGQLSVAAL